jgi:O-acetyl-ADP-ribose deacetylase (regulator of RNase III)
MKIDIVIGDITELEVDCVVNAANPALAAGAGVCGAIFKAAGQEPLQKFIEKLYWHGCPTGSAVATPAFDMTPAIKNIIHAVGPDCRIYTDKQLAEQLLEMTYLSALNLAMELEMKSIAFPLISGGIYGYDPREAVMVAVRAVKLCKGVYDLIEHETTYPDVTFCAFDKTTADMYTEAQYNFTH